MICINCRERDHRHCLNFGVCQEHRTLSEPFVVEETFKRREEPTKTWCDCAHENEPIESVLVSHAIQDIRRNSPDTTASSETGQHYVHGGDDWIPYLRNSHTASDESGDAAKISTNFGIDPDSQEIV